jgi:hypothetical protein
MQLLLQLAFKLLTQDYGYLRCSSGVTKIHTAVSYGRQTPNSNIVSATGSERHRMLMLVAHYA